MRTPRRENSPSSLASLRYRNHWKASARPSLRIPPCTAGAEPGPRYPRTGRVYQELWRHRTSPSFWKPRCSAAQRRRSDAYGRARGRVHPAAPVTPPRNENEPGQSSTAVFSAPVMPAGEFSNPVKEPPAPAAPAAPDVASPAEPLRQPSEFTMLFGRATRQPAPEAAAKPSAGTRGGGGKHVGKHARSVGGKPRPEELVGIVHASVWRLAVPPPAQSVPPKSEPNRNRAAAAPKTPSPEEFANIFDFPLRDSSSGAEPAPKPGPGEFTAMFGRPASPASPPAAKEPGAFTRLFSAPTASELEAARQVRSEGLNTLMGTPTTERKDERFESNFGGARQPDRPARQAGTYAPRNAGADRQSGARRRFHKRSRRSPHGLHRLRRAAPKARPRQRGFSSRRA